MNAAWMVEDAEWQTVAHTNLGVGVFDWAQLSLPLFSLMRIEMEKYDKFFFVPGLALPVSLSLLPFLLLLLLFDASSFDKYKNILFGSFGTHNIFSRGSCPHKRAASS